MTLGQKLKVLLKDNGMTQEDLAERLDVSRQAVGRDEDEKKMKTGGRYTESAVYDRKRSVPRFRPIYILSAGNQARAKRAFDFT